MFAAANSTETESWSALCFWTCRCFSSDLQTDRSAEETGPDPGSVGQDEHRYTHLFTCSVSPDRQLLGKDGECTMKQDINNQMFPLFHLRAGGQTESRPGTAGRCEDGAHRCVILLFELCSKWGWYSDSFLLLESRLIDRQQHKYSSALMVINMLLKKLPSTTQIIMNYE